MTASPNLFFFSEKLGAMTNERLESIGHLKLFQPSLMSVAFTHTNVFLFDVKHFLKSNFIDDGEVMNPFYYSLAAGKIPKK